MRNSRPKGQAQHFYPRPPRGGRPRLDIAKMRATGISIHALREEGDDGMCVKQQPWRNFYPRPPRGGRRTCLYEAGRDEDISIHALREEGDAAVVLEDYEETKFLSTPSARRAT